MDTEVVRTPGLVNLTLSSEKPIKAPEILQNLRGVWCDESNVTFTFDKNVLCWVVPIWKTQVIWNLTKNVITLDINKTLRISITSVVIPIVFL